ncbi:MAG TPA: beta-hexosaminidase, partial [Ruminococcaceae bacterium]|nr:beta-hexosaminidase [Oscillospiraceae bacterium]
TDSLAMGAVTQYTKNKNAAVEAFLAGNDLLLTPDIAESYNALYQAVKSGAVPKKRLDESAARIVAWKLQLGLLR